MVITVIASGYLYLNQKPAEQATEDQTLTPQPSGPLYVYFANGERGPLLEPEKQALRTDEFTGNTVLTEAENYTLEYFPADQTFNIVLLGNNLRASRVAAEQDLLNRFQITEEQACSLRVTVGTIVSVSQEFSGRQLGLSFCPGRVDLPEAVNDPNEAGTSGGVQPDVAL